MTKTTPRGRATSAGGAAKKAAPPKKARKPAVAPKPKAQMRLERFVQEYAVCLNGRLAAIRAGFSPESARFTASELLAKPETQAMLKEIQDRIAASLGITQEMVLDRLNSIATADPRELTELHRCCCRYCWGQKHLYQRTPREMREDEDKFRADEADRQKLNPPPAPRKFDKAGGLGYNPKQDPHPGCPECFGDGVERVVFKDTRDLSPAARLLFAGVEQTQHGLKVRTNSQTDALVNVGKHLGMFAQRLKLGGDPEGSEVKVGCVVVPAKNAGGEDDR